MKIRRLHVTQDMVVIAVLSVILAAMSVVQTIAIRKLEDASVDRTRLADYFRCLVVPDQALYAQLGRDGYVRHCERELG